MPAIQRAAWEREMIKYNTTAELASFIDGLPDYSKYVSNVGEEHQIIYLSAMNVMPDVLTNNNTYPIPIQDLEIEDVPIQLNKHQTKVTPITDDEVYAAVPEKMKNVIDRHMKAINVRKFSLAAHALAPSGDTEDMPVLYATGPDDGTGRKRLIWEDVARLKLEFDNREWQAEGRRINLSSEHENDLILIDQKFKDQYYNRTTGKPYNQLGFDFYSYVQNPYFDINTRVKLAYGAAPDADKRRSTTAFIADYTARANGWLKPYLSRSAEDPLNQRNLYAARHHYIVLPCFNKYRGAIVSPNAV